jgi:DNA-directed RNA polymerase
LFALFNLKVKPLLDFFIGDESKAIVRIFDEATEPYLFLAACIEYKQYQLCLSKNQKYYTGFPIVLDCSGSGPQIVSLLFLMDQFSQFLNLKPNTHRFDFYIAVIKLFLEKKKEKDLIDIESFLLLNTLRGICKSSIMTQLYGVTFRKVSQDLRFAFSKNEKILSDFLHQNIDYNSFVENFIKEFWEFLRQLPLFKLRSFFETINKFLEKKNAVLCWTVLDNSQIVIDYRQHRHKKLDFKDQILGRTQVMTYDESLERDYKKQRTSAQANFIHSIDAYINFRILSTYSSSIFSNHDSWAVGMGNTESLRSLVAIVYKDLAVNNAVLKGFMFEFSELLKTTVSEEASDSFLKFCAKELDLGSYDPEDLTLCKYMVYFGS